MLQCYPSDSAVGIGERYGYSVGDEHGYNYITGGGGMVLSRAAVVELVESGECVCPADDIPDDMFLGMCHKKLHIPIIHTSAFHQVTNDYITTSLVEEGWC